MLLRSFDESVRLLHDRINLERLQSFTPQDLEGRLEPLRQILATLGNPQTTYRTIHVAGTKGKGSTCVMLESILREEGLRVGRFTSPHLYSFTERLMIDGIACPPDDFTELFFTVYEQIEPDTMQSLTYFELLTLLAFVHFARQKVDVAIFEVGLGGRLDATNICCPDVSVITSISYDHMAQLGPTLADIAREKSGIIKPGVPVVTTVTQPEPLDVIRETAKSADSPLFVLDEHFCVVSSKDSIHACVLAAEREVESRFAAITQADIQKNGKSLAPLYTFRYETLPSFPVELTLDDITLQMPGSHQMDNAAVAISAFLLICRAKEFTQIPPCKGKIPSPGQAVLRAALGYEDPLSNSRPERGKITPDFSCPYRAAGELVGSNAPGRCPGLGILPLQGGEIKKSVDTKIRIALRNSFIPLRVEVIRRCEESPTFIFDGAHNRASMQALVKTVTEMFPNRRLFLIFGASLEKDVEGMFAEIEGHFQHIFLTQCSESTRRFPPQQLRTFFTDEQAANITVTEDCKDAMRQCERMANKEDVICVTGSLYLAAELRKC
jgi:folylpolyglutamate synthase/dihydropteroate synthase